MVYFGRLAEYGELDVDDVAAQVDAHLEVEVVRVEEGVDDRRILLGRRLAHVQSARLGQVLELIDHLRLIQICSVHVMF